MSTAFAGALLHSGVVQTVTGGRFQHEFASSTAIPQTDADVVVLEPGSIETLRLAFTGCGPQKLRHYFDKNHTRQGYAFDETRNYLALRTWGFNHKGKQFSASIRFARTLRLTPDLIDFALSTDGIFDLLRNTLYEGGTTENRIEISGSHLDRSFTVTRHETFSAAIE